MFQLMDWLCSKSVQSLDQAALAFQNEKSKRNNFWLFGEEKFSQNLQKYATKPIGVEISRKKYEFLIFGTYYKSVINLSEID